MKDATGIRLIAEERSLQQAKGFDSAHDDTHVDGEIAGAAEQVLHYVVNPNAVYFPKSIGKCRSPHDPSQWHLHIIKKHRKDPLKMLMIAGALIAAEIERRLRLRNTAVAKKVANKRRSK